MLNQTTANVDMEVKKLNRTRIYQKFLTGSPLTKPQLSYELQLSIPTVTNNIRDLLSAELIMPSGSKGNTGGRNAVAYTLVKDARIAVGVDITLHHVVIAVLDLLGDIRESIRYRKTFSDCESYYSELADLIQNHIETSKVSGEQILGIGIGLPVLVDRDRKSVIFNKIIDLKSSVYDELRKYLPYPIEIFNDANAAAFTELWCMQNTESAFYLMLGNSIGGCLLLNGNVYTGITQKAGEIGHMMLIPDGRPCYCGQIGCVDSYLSANNLDSLTGGNLKAYFDLLAAGDPAAVELWSDYIKYLSMTIHSAHALLDCPIILGGYVGEYIEPYLDEIRKKVREMDTFNTPADYIKAGRCKKEAVAAGAALNFIDRFNRSV